MRDVYTYRYINMYTYTYTYIYIYIYINPRGLRAVYYQWFIEHVF